MLQKSCALSLNKCPGSGKFTSVAVLMITVKPKIMTIIKDINIQLQLLFLPNQENTLDIIINK